MPSRKSPPLQKIVQHPTFHFISFRFNFDDFPRSLAIIISFSYMGIQSATITRAKQKLQCSLSPENRTLDVPKGHFTVYVGENLKRFVIPVSYLNHSLFQETCYIGLKKSSDSVNRWEA